jgi:hypothetical protein
VSASSITATIGVDSQQSSSKSLDFDENVPFVIPEKTGTFDLQVNGFRPNTDTARSHVKWRVRRNPKDVLTGGIPKLTPNPDDPLRATLATNAHGSFSIILFCDSTGSGKWDERNTLLVLNLVIVTATVQNNINTIITQGGGFYWAAFLGPPAQDVFYSNATGVPCILFGSNVLQQIQVLTLGGSADATLGLEKITLGWVGKLTRVNWTAHYPSRRIQTWRVNPVLGRLPVLDSARPSAGQGGVLAFRASSNDIIMSPPPLEGALHYVFAIDRPVVPFSSYLEGFPGEHSYGVTGGLGFKEDHLASYSSDFPHSYNAIGSVEWSCNFKFAYVAATGVFKNIGSTVQGPTSVTTSGFPLSATDAKMVTVPPASPACLQRIPPS